MRYITTNTPPTDLHGVADISWHARAACNGVDPGTADELFFHTPNDDYAIAEAKEICSWCPVRRECFNYALDNEVKEGVWGGLTESERLTWHDQVENRLDYSRVKAAIEGRDVQLSRLERRTLTRYASAQGWAGVDSPTPSSRRRVGPRPAPGGGPRHREPRPPQPRLGS